MSSVTSVRVNQFYRGHTPIVALTQGQRKTAGRARYSRRAELPMRSVRSWRLAGAKGSKTIVPIDKDAIAPILDVAYSWVHPQSIFDSQRSDHYCGINGRNHLPSQDLQQQVGEAVETHFDEGHTPRRIRLHFVNDPVLIHA